MSDGKLIGIIVGVILVIGVIGGTVAVRMAGHPQSVDPSADIQSTAPPKGASDASKVTPVVAAKVQSVPVAVPIAEKPAVNPAPVAEKPVVAQPPAAVPPVKPQILDEQFKSFRGIAWGTQIADRSDMALDEYQSEETSVSLEDNSVTTIKNLHTKSYRRNGDKLSFGTSTVGAIHYITYDGAFYQVTVSDVNPFELSTVFGQVYGKAKEDKIVDTTYWLWTVGPESESLNVSMSYRRSDRLPAAFISYGPLNDQLRAAELKEAKAQLDKAKKDF